ncbi:DM13 domain-containing protein [Catenovulum sp. SX2]|uniref:DM13 domain-containing protein n=1 Tax=Catenovulum sp. SX2 TaxID=3398614 RepID=UPI003F85402E
MKIKLSQYIVLLAAVLTLASCGSDTKVDIDAGGSNSEQMNDDMDMMADYQCGQNDHPSVGKTMVFSTLAHDVSGSAQIIDNCTIRVSAFNYDGGGPAVYFYGGIDGNYRDDGAGFAIGPMLNGTVYSGDSIDVTLTSADQLDKLNGLSVWCADFNVSFGDGLFM